MMNEKNDTRSDQSATPEADQRVGEVAVTRHTPGPWRVDDHDPLHDADAIRTVDGTLVATTRTYTVLGGVVNGWQNPADAHLIAAAPDLLAALKGLLARHQFSTVTEPLCKCEGCEQARAAIAKAEGR